MSVETTTGSSDAAGGIGSAVSGAVAAAEQVLSHRFGASVRLAEPEDLGGSGSSTVVRVRVAATPFSLPRTLVVKRYGPAEPGAQSDAFVQEAVSYQLFTALAPEERMCPELFAQSGVKRLVVLEDLGRAPTLADKLLGDDARAAERALLSWSRSLGRLHASTAGREARLRRAVAAAWRGRVTDPLASDGPPGVRGTARTARRGARRGHVRGRAPAGHGRRPGCWTRTATARSARPTRARTTT